MKHTALILASEIVRLVRPECHAVRIFHLTNEGEEGGEEKERRAPRRIARYALELVDVRLSTGDSIGPALLRVRLTREREVEEEIVCTMMRKKER